MKSWLQDNDTENYSTHNEGKPAVAGRFIKALRNKITNKWLQHQKNTYIEKLTGISNRYNITYHRTIELKPADLNSNTYFDFDIENDKIDPEFEVVMM